MGEKLDEVGSIQLIIQENDTLYSIIRYQTVDNIIDDTYSFQINTVSGLVLDPNKDDLFTWEEESD